MAQNKTCLERHFGHHIRLQDRSPVTLGIFLSRTLLRVSSAASHWHSSVHVHQHLTIHLVTVQLHLISFTTVSGAGLKRWERKFHHHAHAILVLQDSGFCNCILCPNVRTVMCKQYFQNDGTRRRNELF